MTPETETPIVDELAAIAAFYAERDALAAQQPTPEPMPEPVAIESQSPVPDPTMNDYYIRCKQSDKDKLFSLAIALGILTEDHVLSPQWEGGWSEVGTIYRDDQPICDEDGLPYWHANLRLKIVSLTDLAVSVASTNPEVAAALADLSGWFVSDAQGQPVPPTNPAQVWL